MMALGATALTLVLVPESRQTTPGRVNWAAAAVLSGWLVALLLAVSEGPTWGWGSGRTVGLFLLAVVLAVLWIRVELRSSVPLIDMRMMRLPVVWTTNLAAFLFGVGMYASYAFVPEFVQTPASAGYGFGASVTKSGLFLFPLTVTMFVCGMASGRLSRWASSKAVLIVGSAVTALALLTLALAHGEQWEIFVATGVLGAGFGLAYSAMSNLIVEAVPPEQTGVASGMNANIRNIGGSIGAAVMATVVTSGVRASALPKESGYTHGFLALTIAVVFATVASVLVPSRRSAAAPSEQDVALLPAPGFVSASRAKTRADFD
jgi:predicted MFS family arabinose efflux permease